MEFSKNEILGSLVFNKSLSVTITAKKKVMCQDYYDFIEYHILEKL